MHENQQTEDIRFPDSAGISQPDAVPERDLARNIMATIREEVGTLFFEEK